MSEDDRAVMERLAALEAEVKADAETKRARREAAMAKVREQRAAQLAERDELLERQAALVTRKQRGGSRSEADAGHDDLGGALELARQAHGFKQELTRRPKQGDKSWIKSGVASMVLGPVGWLYAGSLREAVPASAAWIAFAVLASKFIPMFLLFPVLLVALPLSGLAGMLYAVQYNRSGKRERMFGDKATKKKQLRGG